MSQGRTAEPLNPQESRRAFVEIADTPEYQELRSRFRGFAFPMTVAGLASFFVFVLLSIFAVDFMAQPFPGLNAVNVGLVIGFVQFAVVWIWTALYVNYMNKRIDPATALVKEELERKGAV